MFIFRKRSMISKHFFLEFSTLADKNVPLSYLYGADYLLATFSDRLSASECDNEPLVESESIRSLLGFSSSVFTGLDSISSLKKISMSFWIFTRFYSLLSRSIAN
jgi:hypothetical protein